MLDFGSLCSNSAEDFGLGNFGFRILGFGFWISDFWTLDFEFWISDFGFRIWNFVTFFGAYTSKRILGRPTRLGGL